MTREEMVEMAAITGVPCSRRHSIEVICPAESVLTQKQVRKKGTARTGMQELPKPGSMPGAEEYVLQSRVPIGSNLARLYGVTAIRVMASTEAEKYVVRTQAPKEEGEADLHSRQGQDENAYDDLRACLRDPDGTVPSAVSAERRR